MESLDVSDGRADRRTPLHPAHRLGSFALWLVASACLAPLEAARAEEPALAIVGARLIDGTGAAPLEDATVIIADGRIVWAGPSREAPLPAAAKRIEARGRTIIPGLADMHHHLSPGYATADDAGAPKQLARLLRWGVTTVFVPHSPSLEEFRLLKATARVPGGRSTPRFLGSGPMVTAPGGHFSARAAGGLVADSPERARLIVRELEAAGVDAIKFAYDDLHAFIPQALPVMDGRAMAALVDEAHRLGLKAYAHAPVLALAKEALRAGADGLVHGVLSDPVDGEFIDLMRRNRAVYISTQSLYVCFNDPSGWIDRLEAFDQHRTVSPGTFEALRRSTASSPFRVSDAHLGHAYDNLLRLHQEAIPIIAGTDSGVVGVVSGLSSPMEVALLVEAGLPPMEAIRSATLRAAEMMELAGEFGSVEAGKAADMVLLDGDPLRDIRNLARVAAVIRGGIVYGDAGQPGLAGARPFPGE